MAASDTLPKARAMPFTLSVEPDFVRLTLVGTVTRADLLDMAAEAARIEATFDPTPDRLVDLTGVAVLDVGYPDIQLVASRRKASRLKNDVRSALVVQNRADLGVARMFQTLNNHPQITFRIFDTVGEAEAWLRESER
jgi:hypothetical protein